DVSSSQAGQRLPKRSAGQHPIGCQRLTPVDYQQVKVTLQSAMLKAVVENEQRPGFVLRDLKADGIAVWRDPKPNLWLMLPYERGLVSQELSWIADILSRGQNHRAPCRPAITATQQRGSPAEKGDGLR
ncbi:MAG: hypothetical protein ABSH28_20765, partial [Acidobacteriota bacterium]